VSLQFHDPFTAFTHRTPSLHSIILGQNFHSEKPFAFAVHTLAIRERIRIEHNPIDVNLTV
jgi:hypothetical protein